MYQRLKTYLQPILGGDTLKAKVFRGGAWLGAGSVAEQATRFGRNMILTRLLAPQAFGEMAIVLSAVSVIHTIMDIGVREALIQNPRGSEDEYVGAAWWMAFGRSASFWAILTVIAPLIAKFYGNPELTALFRVSAVGVLFEGALSSRAYVAIREMKFRKWAIINHGGAIVGVVVTLILSLLIKDVWALVLGYGAETVGRCVLSFVVCPYLPPLRWPMAAIRDLLHYSRKAFGLSLLNLIFARADIFVLAKMVSPTELGLYTMAIYLVQTPTSFIMNLLGQTLLPTFAQIQDDKERINRILIQVTSALALVGMPAIFFLYFCGHSLLQLVYGSRYSAAATPLVIASLVALLNLLNGQITSIFFAKGTPQLHRRSVVIMAIVMIVLIYPFVRWFGLSGGQLAALVSIVAGFLFQIERVNKLTDLNVIDFGKLFLVAVGVSLGVAVVCIGARTFIAVAHPIPNILVGLLGCLIAYGISAGLLQNTLKLRN
jgi:lipopolysaccharide exporter